MKINTHKIQKELARRNWSYTDLGKAMGKTRQYVSLKLKHPGSSHLSTVKEFAEALDLEEKDILIGD